MSGRLPFDPGKMAAGRGVPGGSREPPGTPARAGKADDAWTVTQLAARVDTALKGGLPKKFRVVGEVSGLTRRTHWYFQLKDEGAVISAIAFASVAAKVRVPIEEGMEVVVSGRIDFYAKFGRTSVIVDSIEAVGMGALEARFRALCDELRAQGWFEDARKRVLPVFPRKIAVVTSKTGAALQDVIDTARRRCPAVELVVVDVRVQGESAAPSIVHALDVLSKGAHRWGIDAVLLTRGGGSIEDLWAFNEREVAEAVLRCAVPIVAAIGHESDTTIAELVADLRSATPTQAAMRLVPDRDQLLEQVDALGRRARDAIASEVRYQRERVIGLARTPVLARPEAIVGVQASRVDALAARLAHAVKARAGVERRRVDRVALRLERERPVVRHAKRAARVEAAGERLSRAATVLIRWMGERVDARARELRAIDPLGVLARGYSVTRLPDGRVVSSASEVAPGTRVKTTLGDGSFESDVVGGSDGRAPGGAKRRARRRSSEPRDQMDLFGA